MSIIYKTIFFISIILTLAAIAVLAIYGLKFGVDFKGGSVIEIAFKNERPGIEKISEAIGIGIGEINYVGDKDILIKTKDLTEPDHQVLIKKISDAFGSGDIEEKRFESVGPIIGQELKKKSLIAIALVLISIMIYIAFVFRQLSKALSPWAMGVAAIVALAHDIIIPIGIFALLGQFGGIEISAIYVAAVLTILGYSVSDTIVVFDRVRENIIKGSKESFGEVVHRSIMQTLTRSLNTTITVLLSLVAIYFFGGESIKYFALMLIIGVFLGAYSSIFVASPLLVWFGRNKQRKQGAS